MIMSSRNPFDNMGYGTMTDQYQYIRKNFDNDINTSMQKSSNIQSDYQNLKANKKGIYENDTMYMNKLFNNFNDEMVDGRNADYFLSHKPLSFSRHDGNNKFLSTNSNSFNNNLSMSKSNFLSRNAFSPISNDMSNYSMHNPPTQSLKLNNINSVDNLSNGPNSFNNSTNANYLSNNNNNYNNSGFFNFSNFFGSKYNKSFPPDGPKLNSSDFPTLKNSLSSQHSPQNVKSHVSQNRSFLQSPRDYTDGGSSNFGQLLSGSNNNNSTNNYGNFMMMGNETSGFGGFSGLSGGPGNNSSYFSNNSRTPYGNFMNSSAFVNLMKQQDLSSEFHIHKEDFPALPAQNRSDIGDQINQNSNSMPLSPPGTRGTGFTNSFFNNNQGPPHSLQTLNPFSSEQTNIYNDPATYASSPAKQYHSFFNSSTTSMSDVWGDLKTVPSASSPGAFSRQTSLTTNYTNNDTFSPTKKYSENDATDPKIGSFDPMMPSTYSNVPSNPLNGISITKNLLRPLNTNQGYYHNEYPSSNSTTTISTTSNYLLESAVLSTPCFPPSTQLINSLQCSKNPTSITTNSCSLQQLANSCSQTMKPADAVSYGYPVITASLTSHVGSDCDKSTTLSVKTYPDGRITDIPGAVIKDQFGILGLLSFIRSTDVSPKSSILGLGTDLTSLGLNLNSSESVCSTFSGPFDIRQCLPFEIDHIVPNEYHFGNLIKERLPPFKPSEFGDDLLFYLFYCFPNDMIQLLAAHELYERDWRFHFEDKLWLTKIYGLPSIEKTPTYERGTYSFFDPISWRKLSKEFVIHYNKLEDKPYIPHLLDTTFSEINKDSQLSFIFTTSTTSTTTITSATTTSINLTDEFSATTTNTFTATYGGNRSMTSLPPPLPSFFGSPPMPNPNNNSVPHVLPLNLLPPSVMSNNASHHQPGHYPSFLPPLHPPPFISLKSSQSSSSTIQSFISQQQPSNYYNTFPSSLNFQQNSFNTGT